MKSFFQLKSPFCFAVELSKGGCSHSSHLWRSLCLSCHYLSFSNLNAATEYQIKKPAWTCGDEAAEGLADFRKEACHALGRLLILLLAAVVRVRLRRCLLRRPHEPRQQLHHLHTSHLFTDPITDYQQRITQRILLMRQTEDS